MKHSLFIVTFFFSCILFSCTGKHSTEKVDPRFIGTWELPVIDGETKEVLGKMKMTFTSAGKIIYDMNETSSGTTAAAKPAAEDIETYYITDGYLYTKKEGLNPDKAKYKFATDDELLLYFEGNTQTLTRLKTTRK